MSDKNNWIYNYLHLFWLLVIIKSGTNFFITSCSHNFVFISHIRRCYFRTTSHLPKIHMWVWRFKNLLSQAGEVAWCCEAQQPLFRTHLEEVKTTAASYCLDSTEYCGMPIPAPYPQLCDTHWPGTHYVNQTDLKLTEAQCDSWVLGYKGVHFKNCTYTGVLKFILVLGIKSRVSCMLWKLFATMLHA